MTSVPVTVNDEGKVEFDRFFFLLPEPLAIPASTLITDQVGNDSASFDPASDDPLVWLRFHQTDGKGRLAGGGDDLFRVVERVMGLERTADPVEPPALAPYTVVEAVTAAASPDHAPEDWSGRAFLLTPRSDALVRCIRLADDHARAYRLATSAPYGRVTYERIPSPVLAYRTSIEPGETLDRAVADWDGPAVLMLEHTNTADPVRGPMIEGGLADVVDHWLNEIRHGSPLVRWRELLLDAKNAVTVGGDTAIAVVLAQTASEVFLDSMLQLLMWEEGLDPVDAAGSFVEGKVVARSKSEFAKRLGGAWVAEGSGPLARWVQRSSRVRHRVVHGGYVPLRIETDEALDAVHGLEKFVYERLVAKRNQYPRTTLLTVAQQGLERRNLWGGKIKKFSEDMAPNEPSWRVSFYEWRSALVAEQLRIADE